MQPKENFRRIDLKRKYYGGKNRKNFKKFRKAVPKFIKNNPENIIAREKEKNDPYEFTDDEKSDDDLGMGIEISDLPFLCNQDEPESRNLFSLTQDTVGPMFANEEAYDQLKVNDALAELRYKSFRPLQEDAIKRILLGRSTLFISPTGSGKSLCYQLPALLCWRYKKYITLVISPLISLMEDQIKNFPSELRAVSLNSGSTKQQRQHSFDLLLNGEAQVAFMSPEAIVNGVFTMDDLKNLPPVGFVCIDEAHCLCEWSQNFRPAYQQFFNILHNQLNIKTYLGLTATSTRPTSIAIASHLHIDIPDGIIGSTHIPENLILSVTRDSNKDLAIVNLLKSTTFKILSSIIIYCSRREDTERLASTIRALMQRYSTIVEAPVKIKSGQSQADPISTPIDDAVSLEDQGLMRLNWDAEAYHAGISMEKRKQIQRKFIKGELRVVVATIAFGMGINKSNVKAVIHYDMPGSFESYIQEIGRAGRDGKPAQCHMILHTDQTDMYWQQRNIYGQVAEYKDLKKLVDYLFPICDCQTKADEEQLDELKKKNEDDPHFIEESINPSKKDNVISDKNNQENDMDGRRLSLVRKHRSCKGHEVAFSIEEATQALNINSESIITLICRIQKAYPQLNIEINNPIQSQCKVVCQNGPKQLESLLNTINPIKLRVALKQINKRLKPNVDLSEHNKLNFDLVEVANMSGLTSGEVRRYLKQSEWALDDKTGRYKRSHIRTCLSGLSYHLKVVTDLTDEERLEINKFLKSYTTNYIQHERRKIAMVYKVFREHALELGQMDDKIIRLKTSFNLKATLHRYFQSEDMTDISSPIKSKFKMDHLKNNTDTDKNNEEMIRRRIKSFISSHGTKHSSRAVARVLQGISTPNYPAEVWGTTRNFWRTIVNIDFEVLNNLCEEELFSASRTQPIRLPERPKAALIVQL